MAKTLHIETEHVDDKLILTPVDRIDSSVARDFEDFVHERMTEGNAKLIVDFSRLGFISSAGMRVLLINAKKLRIRGGGGKLVLCNMRDSIREIFSISGFDHIITICGTREEALEAL